MPQFKKQPSNCSRLQGSKISRHSSQRGFTFMEALIVVFIIGILISIGVTSVHEYYRRTNGLSCGNNMRNIQAAKDAWIKDYPQTPTIPSEAELIRYLRGPIPSCPNGGTHLHTLDCNVPIQCSLNGQPGFEPAASLPLDGNSYHDLAMPK